MKFDSLDVYILSKIQNDARASFSELAGGVDVSEGTIFSRIKKLEENDIIRGYKARLNRRQMGELITAVVGLEIVGKDLNSVTESIGKIPHIKYLYITHGIYNAIAVIHAKNLDHLRMLTNDDIAKIEGVRRMQVLVALDIMKENLAVDLDRFSAARNLEKIAVVSKKKTAAASRKKKAVLPDELDIYIYKTESPVFDKLDQHILRVLQKNARASFKEIAKKTSVSEGTIYVRVKKLVENGIIEQFYADLNPRLLEENISAFIGININRKEFDQKALLAKAREGNIKSLYIVSGVFDGVMYVKARSLKELNDFVWNELSLMSGIKNNQTFINLKTIKEDYDVVL